MELITKSASETQEAAVQFADSLTEKADSAIVIALTGDLGAGKTTFMQGFAKAVGVQDRIISPTFVLMRRYPIASGILYHLDMYRLENDDKGEVENLGLPEIWSTPGNIVVIEWAEKIKDLLPEHTKWVTFEHTDEDYRKIVW